MKRIIALTVTGLALTGAAHAAGITVVQTRTANVYGSVQVGRQVQPTTVMQTGTANVAGVVQASGGSKTVSITQTGAANAAVVGQLGGSNAALVRQVMP